MNAKNNQEGESMVTNLIGLSNEAIDTVGIVIHEVKVPMVTLRASQFCQKLFLCGKSRQRSLHSRKSND
jgi:hypothetical protein